MSLRRGSGMRACLADAGQDLRYALRTLRSRPTFLLAAVLALGLGTGATTAIFSVVDAVLLRPLPFAEPHGLTYLLESKLPEMPEFSVSPGNFLGWQAQNSTFDSMAAYGRRPFDLTGAGEPERLAGDRTTFNLFRLLGVRPVIGREFLAGEDVLGGPPVVLLSYGLWQRRFGGDAAIVGRTITLNGLGHTVIGIMPAAMQVLLPTTELWVPMAFTDRERQQHGNHFLRAIGRLKPGVSVAEARADLDTLARRLETEHPEDNTGWRVIAAPLEHYFVRTVRPPLMILLGAVGLLLVAACANVANLLLARGMGRQKEIAVRSALGAGRSRLMRQLLAESLVVALAGGAAGLGLAHWLLRVLLALAPAALPRAADIGLDLRAVAFVLALSLCTPFLFGLPPSLKASRTNLIDLLRTGGRAGHGGVHRRTRRALIVTEIALATILLVGSGLLVRSFARLQQVDPGFTPSQAIVTDLALPGRKYPEPADAYRFYRNLVERVASLPGVGAAGVTAGMPLSSSFVTIVLIEGRPPMLPSQRPPANYYSVSPGYFGAMGIRLLRGRAFTEQDGPTAPRVAVISETFARLLFPGEEPIGKRVQVDMMGPDVWREVVGIVADTRQYGLTEDSTSQFYEPYGQLPFSMMTLIIRTAGDPAGVTPALREAVRTLDPDLPVGQVRTLEDLVAQSISRERFSAFLMSTFAASALALAVIGLYGVLAYAVGQRRLEIGVRLALGARPVDVLRMFVREGFGLALAGTAIGIAGALALSRLMTSMLFGVDPADPATLTLVPVALLAAAVLASLLPAYRAMRTDSVLALRGE